MPPKTCRVAVVGAGAAGLVTARELQKEGHAVVVFEQGSCLGGTWVYTDQVETDPLGRDPARVRVHSSMYAGLTTNLPREVMGFSDFPLSTRSMAGASVDARRFPCSEEVLRYLEAFADTFQLRGLVRFNSQVTQVTPLAQHSAAAAAAADTARSSSTSGGRWRVQWRDLPAPDSDKQQQQQSVTTRPAAAGPAEAAAEATTHAEVFDAVLVCNGHYTEPHLPDSIPGASAFPGVLMHSHSYRSPGTFKGQHVAVVGASFSGLDIARLVSQQAACVYVCAREWRSPADLARPAVRGCSNTQRRGMITRLTAAGGAAFSVGAAVPHLDAVILCTGYSYHFPFLDLKALGLSTQQQHVSPLYQHMFSAAACRHQPGSLAFIGLPWRVVPFPMFELQAKLCARVLSGRASLPPSQEMVAWAQQHAQQLEAQGLRPEQRHCLDYRQLHYHRWLAAQCGPDVSLLPNWRAYVLHGLWLYMAVTHLWRTAVTGWRSLTAAAASVLQQQQASKEA